MSHADHREMPRLFGDIHTKYREDADGDMLLARLRE
jgi:hypothetical protein